MTDGGVGDFDTHDGYGRRRPGAGLGWAGRAGGDGLSLEALFPVGMEYLFFFGSEKEE